MAATGIGWIAGVGSQPGQVGTRSRSISPPNKQGLCAVFDTQRWGAMRPCSRPHCSSPVMASRSKHPRGTAVYLVDIRSWRAHRACC